MALVRLGDVDAARVQLTRLDAKHPDQPVNLHWLARLDYFQRLYDAAVEKLRGWLSSIPPRCVVTTTWDSPTTCWALPMKRRARSQRPPLNPEAASSFSLASRQPGISALPRAEIPREAEDSLRESLQYNPDFALAHYHLGRVLEKLGRDEAAAEEDKSAAALDVKFPEPLYSLGLLYRRTGKVAESENTLREYRNQKERSSASP